jgi:cell division protein FtsW
MFTSTDIKFCERKISIIYLYLKSSYYFIRQLVFALLGVATMYIASRFPMAFFRRFSLLILAGSIGLLFLVPLIGLVGGGARRWIGVGSFTIQPSEIAKIGVILAFASMICRYREKMKTFRYGIMPFAAILGVIVFLLALEPHLSAAIIIILVGAVMLFLGGARLYWFIGGAAAVAALGAVAISVLDYAKERVANWLNPFAAVSGDGYQIVQSLYAVGSGGLMGVGLGQSRQKYLYLPEEHNDFIFSVVCEELGFIGATVILILFALLIARGFFLAMHCKERYSFLVCSGVTALLAIQVILNVAVVTNLVPCTGISLPFFSYGGTALWLQLAEMGVILSISRDVPEKKFIKPRASRAQNGKAGAGA